MASKKKSWHEKARYLLAASLLIAFSVPMWANAMPLSPAQYSMAQDCAQVTATTTATHGSCSQCSTQASDMHLTQCVTTSFNALTLNQFVLIPHYYFNSVYLPLVASHDGQGVDALYRPPRKIA